MSLWVPLWKLKVAHRKNFRITCSHLFQVGELKKRCLKSSIVYESFTFVDNNYRSKFDNPLTICQNTYLGYEIPYANEDPTDVKLTIDFGDTLSYSANFGHPTTDIPCEFVANFKSKFNHTIVNNLGLKK